MKQTIIKFLKPLKNLKLWEYFNFTASKRLNGTKIKVPILSKVGFTNLVWQQNWLDLLIKQYFTDNQEQTFIDVGANLGQTLMRLKTIYPKVNYLGFEPNSTCTTYLQKLISINNFKQCTVLNTALSTEPAILTLEKNNNSDSCASIIKDLRPGFFTSEERVLAINYDQFYLDERIGFIKVDVEGAEYEVLKGMEKSIQKHKPLIACEVLDSFNEELVTYTQKRATALCEMLKSWNYGIIQLQTDENKIIEYRKLNSITIVPWTTQSYGLNDYIFYQRDYETKTINLLNKIVKK